jgi:hypothetical protein
MGSWFESPDDMLEFWQEHRQACIGECGRDVVDLRVRGQRVVACSAECRRRYFSDMKRMDRRATLATLSLNCVECGADLTLFRSDVRYCSPRCRVRAHRKRQREALRLRVVSCKPTTTRTGTELS